VPLFRGSLSRVVMDSERAHATQGRKKVFHAFTQQRLKAWQPVFTPRRVTGVFVILAVICVGLGAWLLAASQSVVQYSAEYTDSLREQNITTLDLTVTETMTAPVFLYYQLEGFYQNHRRYVKSRDDFQLEGTEQSSFPVVESDVEPASSHACNPWVIVDGLVQYPCGLVARSVFNDSFHLFQKTTEGNFEPLQMDESAAAIAWDSDIEYKFTNADPYTIHSDGRAYEEVMNMWILERFPPEVCVWEGPAGSFAPMYPRMRRLSDSRLVPDCNYSSSTCNFTDVLGGEHHTICDAAAGFKRKPNPSGWGVENGHFIVWMRTAALPTFRKLYGKIDKDIEAGTTVRVHIANHFPLKAIEGKKFVVLSTSSVIGGRNDFLGLAYIVVGALCTFFALMFAVAHVQDISGRRAAKSGPDSSTQNS